MAAIMSLLELRARYQSGLVHMTWKLPPGAPETVYIYSVQRNGENLDFDMRTSITKDLRDCTGGLSFGYTGISESDVKRVTFCVFLAEHNSGVTNVRELQQHKDCFVNVIIGAAFVSYDIRSKPCMNGLVEHRIWIQSGAEIDSGILGYGYNFNGREISIEFPGKINGGTTEYPPIYLPGSAVPMIQVVGGRNSDVAVYFKRFSFFERKWARKLR